MPGELKHDKSVAFELILYLSCYSSYCFVGNVAFDPVSSRLVFTTDSANGEASNAPEPLIPYTPYPINPETGLPVETNFPALDKRGDMKFNGPMTDPVTGLTTPILGMTIHPEKGKGILISCLSDMYYRNTPI